MARTQAAKPMTRRYLAASHGLAVSKTALSTAKHNALRKDIYVRTKSRMELLTDELQAQLPPLYTQEHEEDPMLTTRRWL